MMEKYRITAETLKNKTCKLELVDSPTPSIEKTKNCKNSILILSVWTDAKWKLKKSGSNASVFFRISAGGFSNSFPNAKSMFQI